MVNDTRGYKEIVAAKIAKKREDSFMKHYLRKSLEKKQNIDSFFELDEITLGQLKDNKIGYKLIGSHLWVNTPSGKKLYKQKYGTTFSKAI